MELTAYSRLLSKTPLDPYRKRGLALIFIMSALGVAVTGVSLYIPYQAAFEQQRERLVESAQSQARMIEAVARFDRSYQEHFPGGFEEAALRQIREAHANFKGFGRTGEFTLAKREGDQILFLLAHRHYDLDNPEPVPLDSQLAAPMRAALTGRSGHMVGQDYRGVNVLAAFEPVAVLDYGVVAKIDLSEVREPFIHATLMAVSVGFILVLLGTLLFLRVGGPLMHRLVENELKYRAVFEHAPEGILLVNARRGQIVEFNDMAHLNLGYTREEFADLDIADLDVAEDPAEIYANLRTITAQGALSFETRLAAKGQGTRDVIVNAQVIHVGLTPYILAIISDITERKRMEADLQRLATRDALTGLYNRAEIERLLAEEIGRAKRYGHRVSLFLIDIDYFKRVNDTWGHPAGDLALQRFARVLQETIRDCDRAGRYGGEEFLVMLPETDLEQAMQLAERLLAGVRGSPLEISSDQRINLTISLGIAGFPHHGNSRDQVIGAADKALYSAKRSGRDRTCRAA